MQSMTKFLKATIANSPLVANLQNQHYLEIILNGKSSLASRFAQVNVDLVKKELINRDLHRVPLRLRKVLRTAAFLDNFLQNVQHSAAF